MTKTGPAQGHVGDKAVYTLTVTATGASVPSPVVTDQLCDLPPVFASGDTNANGSLDVGESWTYTCSHVLTVGDAKRFVNTATVTGGGTSATATASTDVIHPAIDVVKDAPTSGFVDETITYTYTVTNSGDVPLHDVVVKDDKLGDIGTVATLAPGQTVTFTGTTTLTGDVSEVVNVATAGGLDPLDTPVSATDTATVAVVAGEVITPTPTPTTPPPVTPEVKPIVIPNLPYTGFNAGLTALVGFVLTLAGLPLVVRRRRTE